MADLYSKLIKPYLSAELVVWLQPYAEYLNVATPFVVAGIIIWAILYTYYKVDKQITRDPRVLKKLREFFVLAEPFTQYTLQSESEYPRWKGKVQKWDRDVMGWISENMSNAARVHFSDLSNALPFRNRAEQVNEEHGTLIILARKKRDNLKDLIQSGAWDSKDRYEEGKWRLVNIFRSKKRAAREK